MKLIFKIITRVRNFFEPSMPMLGRWKIKNCNNNMTNINSVYQNRDHCGDIICKMPVKANQYNN
jgi:hypothetical protein